MIFSTTISMFQILICSWGVSLNKTEKNPYKAKTGLNTVRFGGCLLIAVRISSLITLTLCLSHSKRVRCKEKKVNYIPCFIQSKTLFVENANIH